MPQFDFANVFLPQLVWLAVFFAILYVVVLATLPRLGKVMQAREDQVSNDLDTAENAKATADKLQADYDAGVASAQDAARARLTEARTAAAKALEAKLAESNAALAARADAAEADLNAARTAAMSEIEAVAADAASDIVEKLTGKRPTPAAASKAARSALA